MDIYQSSLLIPDDIREQIVREFYPNVKPYGSNVRSLEMLAAIDLAYITKEETDLTCAKCIVDLRQRWYQIIKFWKENNHLAVKDNPKELYDGC